MAKESQKPPYEDSAVAPKVLPTAISLRVKSVQGNQNWHASLPDSPHASQ